jgi:hypothetical protein
MKAIYQPNSKLTFEVEGNTQIEIFKQLAAIDEVFGDLTCTYNGDTTDNVRFIVRQDSDENEYYELQVPPSESNSKVRYAKKHFGVHKGGKTLFPKKWENGGLWAKYNATTKTME